MQCFSFLNASCPSQGAKRLTQTILVAVKDSIPTRILVERKSTHPWLNSRVLEAIARKQAASGTNAEPEASRACREHILCEFMKSVDRTRERLGNLSRGSKQWWGLARQPLDHKSKYSSVPALKTSTGEWIMDAHGKSVQMAPCFNSKFGLRPAQCNEFSAIPPAHTRQEVFHTPTAACAEQVLKELRVDSATTPDGIAARILLARLSIAYLRACWAHRRYGCVARSVAHQLGRAIAQERQPP